MQTALMRSNSQWMSFSVAASIITLGDGREVIARNEADKERIKQWELSRRAAAEKQAQTATEEAEKAKAPVVSDFQRGLLEGKGLARPSGNVAAEAAGFAALQTLGFGEEWSTAVVQGDIPKVSKLTTEFVNKVSNDPVAGGKLAAEAALNLIPGGKATAGGVAAAGMVVNPRRLGKDVATLFKGIWEKHGTRTLDVKEAIASGKLDQANATLRAKEGVWLGEDGMPKAYVPDIKAELTLPPDLSPRIPVPLDGVLQHKQLFDIYPELRDVRVVAAPPGSTYNGMYTSSDNVIELNTRWASDQTKRRDPEKIKSTLLHEVQHAIQTLEAGWGRGSTPERYLPRDFAALRKLNSSQLKLNTTSRDGLVVKSTQAGVRQLGLSSTMDTTQEVDAATHIWDTITSVSGDVANDMAGGIKGAGPKSFHRQATEEVMAYIRSLPKTDQLDPKQVRSAVSEIVSGARAALFETKGRFGSPMEEAAKLQKQQGRYVTMQVEADNKYLQSLGEQEARRTEMDLEVEKLLKLDPNFRNSTRKDIAKRNEALSRSVRSEMGIRDRARQATLEEIRLAKDMGITDVVP